MPRQAQKAANVKLFLSEPLKVMTRRSSLIRVICSLAPASASSSSSSAQSPQANQLAFEVAAVKPARFGGKPYSNFPLGPGDVYIPNGGLFTAANFPLATYIFFAYQIQGNQGQSLVPQLPRWVMTDRFDIQARAEGNPTKNEMRLMMRALLADRFKFAMHTEVREVPVLALVLAKPGKPGPQLQPHPTDSPCPVSIAPSPTAAQTPDAFLQTVAGGFPVLCNGIVGMVPGTAGRLRSGARNVTMEFLANYLRAEGTFGRVVIDASGLTGTCDFAVEWAPQGTPPPGSNFTPDASGPTFDQAIRDQLGLKLESRKSSMEVLVVDHVERPSQN
jgi:uncharacterized protein (TIGR03435 family)